MVPPAGVYLTALLNRLINTWFSFRASAITSSFVTSKVSINSSSCFAFTCGWIILTRLCISSEMLHSCSLICTFPLSILLISRISLIRLSRWLLEESTFCRQSLTCSLLSIWLAAIVANPIIAFIGVRISWDILERNVVFARLACCACISASCSACVCSLCFLTLSVISFTTTMTIISSVSSSHVITKDWRTHICPEWESSPQYSTVTSASPRSKCSRKCSIFTSLSYSSMDSSNTRPLLRSIHSEALQGTCSPTFSNRDILSPSITLTMSSSTKSFVKLNS